MRQVWGVPSVSRTPTDGNLARWLISEDASVVVWGAPVIKESSATVEAVWTGQTSEHYELGALDVELTLRIKLKRIDSPTVLLRCRSYNIAWRVEHNGKHRQQGYKVCQKTHLQLEGEKDFIKYLDSSTLCSPPIGAEHVDNDALCRLLRATASELHVSIQGLQWIQLPEGVQP